MRAHNIFQFGQDPEALGNSVFDNADVHVRSLQERQHSRINILILSNPEIFLSKNYSQPRNILNPVYGRPRDYIWKKTCQSNSLILLTNFLGKPCQICMLVAFALTYIPLWSTMWADTSTFSEGMLAANDAIYVPFP